MEPPESSNGVVRFGVFEADLARAELRKKGLRIRLQEQPFRVLVALLQRPGEMVSREELIRRLWPDGTVVDFERGLNAAVNRLRQALSDSADVPRYVETVARRGYRFIGQVESLGNAGPKHETVPRFRRYTIWVAFALIAAVGAAVAWQSFSALRGRREDVALKVLPLTSGSGAERNPSFAPGGSQLVYEWQREDGTRHLYIKGV